jgi:hypothetical protein
MATRKERTRSKKGARRMNVRGADPDIAVIQELEEADETYRAGYDAGFAQGFEEGHRQAY